MTHWHSDGNKIYATRGSVTVSVLAPIDGQYTDAKMWLSLLRMAISTANLKLKTRLCLSEKTEGM